MKKFNIKKFDNKIIELHHEYCTGLMPEILETNKEGKVTKRGKLEPDLVRFLCCENPFDFGKPENNYLKDGYLEYWKDSQNYNKRNINYITQYEKFRSMDDGMWNGLKLIKTLNVNVCPYCGINYISFAEKIKKGKNKNKIKSIATLDHYLPKKEYPFLAMNIYNLIPCCKNCNTTFKHDSLEPVIYPFEEAVEDYIEFDIANESVIDAILTGKTDTPVKIEITPNCSEQRLMNHIEVLALNERYNDFQNIVKSLIKKRHMYNERYLKMLEDFKIYTKMQLENALIKQDIIGNDEPFSKLKKDIWTKLSRYK